MRRASTTIVGLGILAALFMAIMSTFYLQHIPNQADLARLETDLRSEFGLYLSATAPLRMSLTPPPGGKGRLGVEVVCTMRPDLRKRPTTVRLYQDRMAEAILAHPDWEGKVSSVTVTHSPPLQVRTTRWPVEDEPEP